ncbi:MAG: hypothetical protein ACP5G1_01985 [Nanopusillaceae archaeon]
MSAKCLEDILSQVQSFSNFSVTQSMKEKLSQCYKEIRSNEIPGKFISYIEKTRLPYYTLESYLNKIEKARNNIDFRIIGSLNLIYYLYRDEEKYNASTSNVIDIVCKEKYCVDEMRNIFKQEGFVEIEENVFQVCFGKDNKKICFPNQIGYYVYLSNGNTYVTISAEGSITLQLSKFVETHYIDNSTLFTLLYKFFRFKPTDIGDLISLNNNKDDDKWAKMPKKFDYVDKKKVLEIFGKKGIEKTLKNYEYFMAKHPNSIYGELNIVEILS